MMEKQNLNIGDRLLCKKDLNRKMIDNDDKLKTFSLFIKGKYYSIDDINIMNDEPVNGVYDYFYFIVDEFNKPYSFWFENFFHIYFYTKNEARKLKLKQLNEGTDF